MQGDNFVLETEAVMISWVNPANAANPASDIGFFINGGDAKMVMFGYSVGADKTVKLTMTGTTPKGELNESAKFIPNWKPDDVIKLQLACVNGYIRGTATARGLTTSLEAKPMNFKPLSSGFYTRGWEDAHNVQALFKNLRVQGLFDKERFKAELDNRRGTFARKYIVKAPQANP